MSAPELEQAMAETRHYREEIGKLVQALEEEARLISPSKAAEIKRGVAERLRKILG